MPTVEMMAPTAPLSLFLDVTNPLTVHTWV